MHWVGIALVLSVFIAIIIIFAGDPPDHPKDD